MIVVTGPPREWPVQDRASALTIGVFDGLHLGHRSVIDEVVARADATGATPGVVTFDPHPLTVVAPERAPKMLTDIEQRIELLADAGIALVAIYGFDAATRAWSPEEFVVELLTTRLRASSVVVGEDFRFGRDRAGDVVVLGNLGRVHGFTTIVMPLVSPGLPTSSTGIRRMVAAGDVAAAAAALLRPYEVRGMARDGLVAVPAAIQMPPPGRYAAGIGRSPEEQVPAEVVVDADGLHVVATTGALEPGDGPLRVRFLGRHGDPPGVSSQGG